MSGLLDDYLVDPEVSLLDKTRMQAQVLVPVLRAGLGMLDAFLELVPSAEVGYFGLERNEVTAVARRYYEKVPKNLANAVV